MAKLTKKQKSWSIDSEKLHGVDEAIALAKANATSKFDETIEVALNLGVDPRHADQMVRGVVTLPKGTGKTVRVGVFAKGAKADEAREAGAEVVGAEDLLEDRYCSFSGRTSTAPPRRADGIREARAIAASRSSASKNR